MSLIRLRKVVIPERELIGSKLLFLCCIGYKVDVIIENIPERV